MNESETILIDAAGRRWKALTGIPTNTPGTYYALENAIREYEEVTRRRKESQEYMANLRITHHGE